MRQSHGTFRLHYNDLHLSSEKKSFVCIMGIDNIENLHSWAENIHQNQKDTRSIHTYIIHVLYLYQL